MPAYGYEFYLLVVNSISHSFAALTREISSWPLEDKIHIHARASNILYLFLKKHSHWYYTVNPRICWNLKCFKLFYVSPALNPASSTYKFSFYARTIPKWNSLPADRLACVAGGISRMRAFVLVAKPWTRVAKLWEDWWRVQLNSRLPKFVGFFELCVHQWTRISDWLRVPKRQSSVNLYLSSFPGEKVCFHTQICNGQFEEMQRGSFEFPEYPLEEQKNYANGRTGKGR